MMNRSIFRGEIEPVISSSSISVELATVRDMTAAMLTAAKHQRWSEVQRIDDARCKLLRDMPAALFATSDRVVREIINEALAATKRIEQQALSERQILANELKEVNQRHHAAKAYDDSATA